MTELLLARSTRGSGRARWPCPVREVRGRPGERPGGAVWWMIGSAGVAAQPRPWCSSKGDRGWCGYAGVLALLVPRGGAHVGDGGMFGGVGVGGGDAGDPPALAEVPPRPAGDLVVSGDDADRYRLVVVAVVEALVQGREPDPLAAHAQVGGDDRAAVGPVAVAGPPHRHLLQRVAQLPDLRLRVVVERGQQPFQSGRDAQLLAAEAVVDAFLVGDCAGKPRPALLRVVDDRRTRHGRVMVAGR